MYSVFGILIYINNEYIFDSWINIFSLIEQNINEPFSYLSMFYYGTFSILAILFFISIIFIIITSFGQKTIKLFNLILNNIQNK